MKKKQRQMCYALRAIFGDKSNWFYSNVVCHITKIVIKLCSLFLAFNLIACSAEHPVERIAFTYESSRNATNQFTSVSLEKVKGGVIFHVRSIPSKYVEDYKSLVIDTFFMDADTSKFLSLAKELSSLNKIDTRQAAKRGFDGSYWSLEYGDKNLSKKYTYWVPFSRTEERGLSDFIRICKEILIIGGFDPGKFGIETTLNNAKMHTNQPNRYDIIARHLPILQTQKHKLISTS